MTRSLPALLLLCLLPLSACSNPAPPATGDTAEPDEGLVARTTRQAPTSMPTAMPIPARNTIFEPSVARALCTQTKVTSLPR